MDYKPNLFDVTDWIEKQYINTGGTREKSFLESPDGKSYFFKTSLIKPGRDYKFEFWSEIIASKLGSILNLNMLQYDIAIKGDKIGCISKSMINQEKERLTEGVNYLVGYDNSYDPISKNHQGNYSYQYIKDALTFFGLRRFVDNIEEVIVFDALIGNGDRHQENWAVISEYSLMSKNLKTDAEHPGQSIKRAILKLRDYLSSTKPYPANKLLPMPSYNSQEAVLQAYLDETTRFSPIYDSGSSLGREYDDETLKLILNDKLRFDSYINKGRSEINWQGIKIKHWELIDELRKVSDKPEITIDNFKKYFDEQLIRQMVYEIDDKVPEKFKDFKLTDIRKEFLIKLITLRYNKLISL
ncbi:MAG TPA: hypothetical protein VIQ77_03955 [Mucilaginibacter sp.]